MEPKYVALSGAVGRPFVVRCEEPRQAAAAALDGWPARAAPWQVEPDERRAPVEPQLAAAPNVRQAAVPPDVEAVRDGPQAPPERPSYPSRPAVPSRRQ
jgi:hypothetical protein